MEFPHDLPRMREDLYSGPNIHRWKQNVAEHQTAPNAICCDRCSITRTVAARGKGDFDALPCNV